MKIKPTPTTKFFTLKPTPTFTNPFTSELACPSCKIEKVYKKLDKLFGDCFICGLRVLFFMPYEAQQLAHVLQNRTVLMFSGVSSGKTTLNGWSVIEHALTTPGAAIYVLAQTREQRDKNVKDQTLRQFIDEKKDLLVQNQEQWTFHNNATIYFYTSDDYQKLKSANATMMWLVEAQGFKVEIYFEAQQRARSQAAKTFKKDATGGVMHIKDLKTKKLVPVVLEDRAKILVEGNIDPNSWIRQYGVLQSHTIIGTPNTYHFKLKDFAKPIIEEQSGEIKDIVSIIMSPFDNYYNSPKFLNELITGKPKRWVNQEVYGDLSLESGLLFPLAPKHVINPNNHYSFNNVDEWMWIEGMDFGGGKIGNDPTAYLLGKYNPITGEVLIVREYYRSGGQIHQDIEAIRQIRLDHNYDPLKSLFFVCDPAGRRSVKSDYGVKDTISFYREGGLVNLKPAFASKGANTFTNTLVSSGVVRINEMLALGDLNISFDCVNLNNEMANYRLKEKTLAEQIANSKSLKTIGADHAIDALRYMIMELPYVIDRGFASTVKQRYNENHKPQREISPLNQLVGDILFKKEREI